MSGAKKDRPLRAYAVQEEDEGTGGIVFARCNAEARRRGACRFGDGDFNWGKAVRAPWADSFAPGPVPFAVMAEHGWVQDCCQCGVQIKLGAEDWNGDPVEFDIVDEGGRVYCRPACRDRYLEDRAFDEVLSRIAIAGLTKHLLGRLPGAIECGRPHVEFAGDRDIRHVNRASIGFLFPGGKIGGSIRFDGPNEAPKFYLYAVDHLAFYRWKAAGYPPHMMDSQVEDCL
ncbi:MAG: hypothetical protein GC191_09010 [Azospirillum sp.]|nr:hypothetical protein [Azospirillum sp.]